MGSRRRLPAPPTADDSGAAHGLPSRSCSSDGWCERSGGAAGPEVVERILANGNRAPSAGFTQGCAFLALERANDRARFWETMAAAGHQPEPAEMAAPLLIVPLACKAAYLDRYAEPDTGWTDRDEGRWPIPYWHIDTGFAALLMLLTAVDEELGGLFFGLPPEVITAVRAAFSVPDDHEPIGAMAIGRPRVDRPGRPGGAASLGAGGALGPLVSCHPTCPP
jgi:nitroreductase